MANKKAWHEEEGFRTHRELEAARRRRKKKKNNVVKLHVHAYASQIRGRTKGLSNKGGRRKQSGARNESSRETYRD